MADRTFILDMDVGIDDALAIIYLAGSPGIEIAAVGSVHGNVGAELAALNARRVLELCGLPHVPVAIGCRQPLAQPLETAEWVHGTDGLGNTNQPLPAEGPTAEHAANQLVRLVRERPGYYEVLATGPLTNLALALLLEPELPTLVRSVVVMGGSASGIGNATPSAEANIWHDPEAARLMFEAGWPITMVGLDVTDVTLFSAVDLDALAAAPTAHARFAAAILEHYADVRTRLLGGARGCELHDPLAAGIAVDAGYVLQAVSAPIEVSLQGPTRGMTIVDRREHRLPGHDERSQVLVPLAVDSQRFVCDLMATLVSPSAAGA